MKILTKKEQDKILKKWHQWIIEVNTIEWNIVKMNLWDWYIECKHDKRVQVKARSKREWKRKELLLT